MRIEAENASRWVPSLKVDYRLRMPVNKIAAVQTGIDVMERAQRSGLPISPEWVMEEMMGIEQPWEEFKRATNGSATSSSADRRRSKRSDLSVAPGES